jgi:hypothetical protein
MCRTIDYWDPLIQNWAWWTISGPRTPTSSNPFRLARDWDSGAPRNPPSLVGPAFDVDSLIHRLRPELYRALVIHYLWTGTAEMKAKQAGVSSRTLRDRRLRAIFTLDDMHEARKRGAWKPPARVIA